MEKGPKVELSTNCQEFVRCDCTFIHEEIVNKVQEQLPEPDKLTNLAELFKLLGDPTRLKILWALSEAEMCVCDLAYLLNMTQSAISHQLRVLKQTGLVKNRKTGKVVFYALENEHVEKVLKEGMLYTVIE